MSWSIIFIGKASNVATALEKQSEKLTGDSKVEYDAALPHFIGIVKQNFATAPEPVIKIAAAGHGYSENGQAKNRQCTCSVEIVYGEVV